MTGEFDSGNKSHVIELPEDSILAQRLGTKLKEYRQRLEERDIHIAPELHDAWWKERVLETLLDEGRVDTFVLSRKIVEQLGQERFDESQNVLFNRACGVIEAYVLGGGNIQGGTGLPD